MRQPSFVNAVSRAAVMVGVFVALLADGGCTSSAASDDGAAPSGGGGAGGSSAGAGGGGAGPVDCGAVLTNPPIVQVFDLTTGLAICDPIFTVVGWPDGGTAPASAGATLCTGTIFGCPAPADSGGQWCAFALLGLSYKGAGAGYAVEVSRADYAPRTISDVVPGVGGCVPTVPASDHSVSLTRALAAR